MKITFYPDVAQNQVVDPVVATPVDGWVHKIDLGDRCWVRGLAKFDIAPGVKTSRLPATIDGRTGTSRLLAILVQAADQIAAPIEVAEPSPWLAALV